MTDNNKPVIVKHIAVLGTHSQGWTKELNLVSWGGREAKYDIRDWTPDHSGCSRGCTFMPEEIQELAEVLANMLEDGDLE